MKYKIINVQWRRNFKKSVHVFVLNDSAVTLTTDMHFRNKATVFQTMGYGHSPMLTKVTNRRMIISLQDFSFELKNAWNTLFYYTLKIVSQMNGWTSWVFLRLKIYRVSQKKVLFRKIAIPLIKWPFRGIMGRNGGFTQV